MNGAPADLQTGGKVGKNYDRIIKLESKVDKLCEDVAFIKGKLESAQIIEEHKINFKSGAKIAVIGSVPAAIITAVFALL